jgi:hypothetical protein
MRKLDIKIGDKYGRLTILKELEPRGKNKHRFFQCKCECGIERDFRIYRLTNGITQSCGCLGKEIAKIIGIKAQKNNLSKYNFKKGNIPNNFVDGDNSKIKKAECYYIARLWQGIKQRCYNPNEPGYKWYGAEGIEMYKPWINDRQLFKKWILDNLGHRPEGHSIDRINVNGNYEPDNLRWADKKTQARNKRNVKHKSN